MDYDDRKELPANSLPRLAPRGTHDANAVCHVHGMLLFLFIIYLLWNINKRPCFSIVYISKLESAVTRNGWQP